VILRPSDATNLVGQDTGRRELHQSDISVLLACPRKFDLSKNHGLELIERPRALTLGSAFQKAIEAQAPETGVRALRGEMVCPDCHGEGEREHPERGWVRCDACEGEEWVKDSDVVHYTEMTPERQERLLVDEAIVAGASRLYLSRWPGGPGETREFKFKVRLRSPWTGAYSRTFDLAGAADGLADHATDYDGIGNPVFGGYELIENKLVGQITPQKVQRLPLDRQVAIYRYGIWRATGRRVETVRYRWIRKPQIRQKQNESLTEYTDRIRQDYEDRPDFYLTEEEPQFATTGDLLRIEAELWVIAEQVRHAQRQGVFVRNTAACSDYGGCQFIPVCVGDPDAKHLYRKRVPDDT
jgi:hypothetical protein